MKKGLRKDRRLTGNRSKLTGNCSGLWGDRFRLWGDCSGLTGNCFRLWGDCSGLTGNCTGLTGDCSGLMGNLDDCEITADEKANRIDILDLIMKE